MSTNKEREVWPDLLKCIAMMMIVVLHFLGKGGLLEMREGGATDPVFLTAWLMESLSICAVNVYMLISGYFLSESGFKLSKLISLYLRLWFFSAVLGLVFLACGFETTEPIDKHFLLRLLAPVSMEHYWFMTAYIFMYVMLPILTTAVKHMTDRQLKICTLVLLAVHSFIKSVIIIGFDLDAHGYNVIWYICVFMVAANIRRSGPGILGRKGVSLIAFLAGVLSVFGESVVLRILYARTGHFKYVIGLPLDYNNVFVLLAALGLFGLLMKVEIKGKIASVIKWAGPYTLGAYLLHENFVIRYSWFKWFGSERITGALQLVGCTLIAMIAVFVTGVLIDFVRGLLAGLLNNILKKIKPYKKISDAIYSVDTVFAEK